MAGELVPLDDESVYKISETTKSKPTQITADPTGLTDGTLTGQSRYLSILTVNKSIQVE